MASLSFPDAGTRGRQTVAQVRSKIRILLHPFGLRRFALPCREKKAPVKLLVNLGSSVFTILVVQSVRRDGKSASVHISVVQRPW